MQKLSVLPASTVGPVKSPRLKHPLRSPSSMAKVPSLLFELEMDHGEDAPCVDEHDSHTSLTAVSSLLRPTSEFHRQVRRDVLHRTMRQGLSTTALGDNLRSLGYSTVLHTNHEGDTSVSCLQSLRHTFIVCTGVSGGTEREPLIVDPFFRDQFEMAKATPSYMRFMEAIPQVLVSTEAQLRQLVKILCREMHEAFVKHGASIPPWRGKESLLSKWRLPRLPSTERLGSLHYRDVAPGHCKASCYTQTDACAGSAVVVHSSGSVGQTVKRNARSAAVAASRQPLQGAVPAVQQQSCGARS